MRPQQHEGGRVGVLEHAAQGLGHQGLVEVIGVERRQRSPREQAPPKPGNCGGRRTDNENLMQLSNAIAIGHEND